MSPGNRVNFVPPQGSWGPAAADELVAAHGRSHGLGSRHERCQESRGAPRAESERGCALAIPADRGLRVLVKLPYWRACGAGWIDRLALRAPLRLAERVRQPARPAGRKFSLRTLRDQPSDNADL